MLSPAFPLPFSFEALKSVFISIIPADKLLLTPLVISPSYWISHYLHTAADTVNYTFFLETFPLAYWATLSFSYSLAALFILLCWTLTSPESKHWNFLDLFSFSNSVHSGPIMLLKAFCILTPDFPSLTLTLFFHTSLAYVTASLTPPPGCLNYDTQN